MKKIALLLPAVLTLTLATHSQDIQLSVDGSNTRAKQTLHLRSFDPISGKSLLNIFLPFIPGKTTRQIVGIQTPALLNLEDNDQFLVGARDSLVIGWDPSAHKPTISGGKYPGNYSIYQRIRDFPFDHRRYHPEKDNYIEFVHYLDSVSLQKSTLLQQAWAAGQLSEDVYDYMKAYIRYTHLFQILLQHSAALKAALPRTYSLFVPQLTLEDFHKDEYASNFGYLSCAGEFIRLISDHSKAGDPDAAEISRSNLAALRFAFDSLPPVTRQKVLFFLIVRRNLQKSIDDPAALAALDGEIQALGLPNDYSTPIHQQLASSLLRGKSIAELFQTTTVLSLFSNRVCTLQAILGAEPDPAGPQNRKEPKWLIDCWTPGVTLTIKSSESDKLASLYNDSDYHVLHIAIGDGKPASLKEWAAACEAQAPGLTYNQFYLISEPLVSSTPFAAFFLIKELPRYISISGDTDTIIEDPNIPVRLLSHVHIMNMRFTP